MTDLIEKIRVRIMQEAYDLADRNDSEGYNSVKLMCSDVLALLPTQRQPLTEEPVARVTGYHAGRCVIEPLNRAMVMPIGMALYAKTHGIGGSDE